MANPNDHAHDSAREKGMHERMHSDSSFVRGQAKQADNWARTSRKMESATKGEGYHDPKKAQ